jgi:hypothetical protein
MAFFILPLFSARDLDKGHVLIYLSHNLPGQITCYCPSQEGRWHVIALVKCYCPGGKWHAANYAVFITHANSALLQ